MKIVLRTIRLSQGMSLRHLARLTGISRSSLSRIEHHRQAITNTQIVQCCTALGVPPCVLLDTGAHNGKGPV